MLLDRIFEPGMRYLGGSPLAYPLGATDHLVSITSPTKPQRPRHSLPPSSVLSLISEWPFLPTYSIYSPEARSFVYFFPHLYRDTRLALV